MEYIEKTLGLKVTCERWKHIDRMPFFILDRYDIRKTFIESMETLFLYVKTDLDHIGTVQKHIAKVQKEERLPVVIVLETITRYRREALINAKIPFVVPDKQLYLPFIGAVLQERFDNEETKLDKLLPVTQVLLFYYIYRKQKSIYTSQAVKDLGYSAMSITRAVKQLLQTGFFEETKDGVQKVLTGKLDRKALYEQLQHLLINPVRNQVYVPKDKINDKFCIAGDSALARHTMLNEPQLICYAVESKYQVDKYPYMIDMTKCASVELWKYDPTILSRDGVIDPLSLAMSMKDSADERVEEAIDELLEMLWEEK